MCSLPDDCKIPLYLGMMDNSVKAVVVTKNSNVSIFDKLFPTVNSGDLNYLYNGKLLDKRLSIQLQDINPKDLIIAIRGANDFEIYFKKPQQVKEMLDIAVMNSKERVGHKVDFISNGQIRQESLRLRDLQFAKAELRPKMIKTRVQDILIKKDVNNHTVIPLTSTLSKTELPRFW